MDGVRRPGQDVVVPATLIGSGRSADIFDAGPGRVLRRFRGDRDATAEAELMRQLAAASYPVPDVYDASGPDIIMERLEQCNWSQTDAAESLSVPLSTLNQKIKRLDIKIRKKGEG